MNDVTIIFEEATIEDLPLIVEIYNSTIASRMVTADLEEVSLESKREWFLQFNRETRPLWTISYENVKVGFVGYHTFYGRPAYDGTVEISMYLHENSRGKGLGLNCLLIALEKAPNFQIKSVLAFIFAHNIPSLNLFAKAGFKEWGHLPGIALLDGKSRSLIIMGKKV